MRILPITLCMVLALGLGYAPPLIAQTTATSPKLEPSAIYEKAAPSVVFITCVDEKGQISYGSGVILRSDGVIATNFHVIEGASAAKIQLSNGDIFDDVTIVDTDERKDIAILRIKVINLPPLIVADSDFAKIGAPVYTIGAPRGLAGSLSSGIVSSIRSISEFAPELAGFRVIQFTAPVSPGSSGGALIDESGKLLGLVFAEKQGGQNLSIAIPVNYVAPLAANAKSEGHILKSMPVIQEAPAATRTAPRKGNNDDFEYGSLSELKDIKRVYIETGGETAYRDRLIQEIKKAKIPVEVLDSEDNAQCVILFRNEMINEPWFSGSSAVVEKSRGTGSIVIPGTGQKRSRLLYKFSETKDSWFEGKPYIKLAKMFVKAYQDANR